MFFAIHQVAENFQALAIAHGFEYGGCTATVIFR
jgi:hypothetical protein